MGNQTNLKVWQVISVFLLALGIGTSSVFAMGSYDGGDGSRGYPFEINTPPQLNDIGLHPEDWSSYFILTADIDLAGYTGTAFNIIGDYYGTSFTDNFDGSFDGNGHTISNFTYTTTGISYIGLFGYVGIGGEIKNLGMINVNVDAGSGQTIGGMAGFNNGMISNCYVTGSVSGAPDHGGYVGGLVGYNANIAGHAGLISNCYATCTVFGYAHVGGLLGYNVGTVLNCYATGSVSATLWTVGGLVGVNHDSETQFDADIFASFWDIQTTGQTEGVGYILGNGIIEAYGRTTAEMQMESTFTDYGWDFVNIWGINEGISYPYLLWQIPSIADVIAKTEKLIDDVVALNFQQGIENSLDAKLGTVLQVLDDVNANNNVAAINALDAFINAVEGQRGKKISDADADALIAAAQEIIAILSGA